MTLNLIMLGPPGAGKGTQAQEIAMAHGIPKISTGDILREAEHNGTEIGKRAGAIRARGELVSDDVMIGIVRERLDQKDVQDGFILDGFPRTVTQAVAVEPGRVLALVRVEARRGGAELHNFAGFLVRVADGRMADFWMVDALPAESAAFWSQDSES